MKVLVAGDFYPQAQAAKKLNEGDFASVLGEISPMIKESDFSIVNFESPVAEGHEAPIEKLGPNLRCKEKAVEAVKWAGFDAVTLANNHIFDYGSEGVENTLRACRAAGIGTVGAGMNLQEASQTLYTQKGEETLAVINCCENEFSIATDDTAGAHPLNAVRQYHAIREARQKADYVLVIVHGGHEQFQLPSPRMKETYRFFVDAGADAVVNHHQHCYSGYEVYRGKPIFYGLGNFCFEPIKNMGQNWHEGYMVRISMASETGFEIIPYEQCHGQSAIKPVASDTYSNRLEELNRIIADDKRLKEEVERYYQKSKFMYKSILEPTCNKYFGELQRRGWLPSLIDKSKKLKAIDYVCCESHRDRLMYYLLSPDKK